MKNWLCKCIVVILTLCFVFAPSALCENRTWNCTECGRTGNTGNYCGNCGHPSPYLTDEPEESKEQSSGPKTWNGFIIEYHNGHTYSVVNNGGMTWDKANVYCKSYGGHLAYIKTKEDQLFIENLLKSDTLTLGMYWLGAKRNYSGEFKWLDGTYLTYANWDTKQPDFCFGTEYYLQIYRISNPQNPNDRALYWNDAPNNNTLPDSKFFFLENVGIICEWDELLEPN